ncbi:MAG: hypothetical protein K5647_01490 [Clostridiales bacterium]|nr:hypothetical protein [Clostridiales bacterium]
MKSRIRKIKQMTAAILGLLLLILPILAGCAGQVSGTDTESGTAQTEPEETSFRIELAGADEYRILFPEEETEYYFPIAQKLQNAVEKKTGKKPDIRSDIIAEKAGYREIPFEITLGACNRNESSEVAATLLCDDYEIRLSGTKLVICGGSPEATEKAVDLFIRDFLNSDGVVEGSVLSRFDGVYKVPDILINGVSVRMYTVVYSVNKRDIYTEAADILISRVRELTGYTMKKVPSNSAPDGGYEFQLGDCGRGASAGLSASGMNYMLAADDRSVAIVSGSAAAASKAVGTFVDENIPASATETFDIKVEGVKTLEANGVIPLAQGANIRVMTSNILASDTLYQRIPLLVSVYSDYMPDIIGLQEVNANGHSGLSGSITDLYTIACSKIAGGSSSCYTPILFLKDKYELVESGSFLFDSRWPKTNTKTMAWVVLKDKESGRLVAAINAHWSLILSSYDTQSVFGKVLSNSTDGALWREDNSRQILEKLDELRGKYGETLPVFAMGDMNASPTAKSVTMLNEKMKNASEICTGQKTTGMSSFHSNPGQWPASGSAIDNIFVTADCVKCLRHEIVITETSVASSDHCQVVVDLSY